MIKPDFRLFLILISLSVLTAAPICAAADEEKRPFTVRDSIEMSYFGTVTESDPRHSLDDGAASPDGRYIVRMTHRGVIADGVTEGTIWIFDTKEVLHGIANPDTPVAAPDVLARMSAEINGYSGDFYERGNILFHLMWSDDSRYLYFVGRDGQENRQLFRANITSRIVEPLSLRNQDVMTYLLSGESVAYLAGPDVDVEIDWVSAGSDIPDIVVGTGTPLLPLLYPNFRGYAISNPIELEAWQTQGGDPEPIINSSTGEAVRITTSLTHVGSSASPDGTHQLLTDDVLADTNWIATDRSRSTVEATVKISISESLNQAPVVTATDSESGRSRVIFDPNPQLKNIAMADVRVYEWQDKHGRTVHGGLVLPPNYVPGENYSLVIQTHGFHRNRFFRLGFSETASAGRALAARGIVVLQVAEPRTDQDPRWADLHKLGLDAYLSAIDELAADGIIDPAKVGITGYSETGLFTAASITEAPDRFAAASIANSDPLSITGYYSYVDSPLQGVTERLFGAVPYGPSFQDWIQRSPNMSTDRIKAPVLIFAADPWHLLSLWDLYAALRYQGKPVELQYIRSGSHNLKKPAHKLAHQEMLVDWFDFWLNGNEEASAGKTEQYSRWREMKNSAPRSSTESSKP